MRKKKLKHLVTTGLILKEKDAGERSERRYSMNIVVSNINTFVRGWIPHMLGAALNKIMYRQPLP